MSQRRRRVIRPSDLAAPTMRTLLGIDFVKRLTDATPDHAPLRIGRATWSTHALAVELGVVHTRAARLLTLAAAEIGATSVADLYKRSSPYTFAGVAGFGQTTMYVLWRLFESAGLDPDAWANAGDRDDALVSFRSLKLREQRAEQRAVAETRARRRRETREQHKAAVAAVLAADDNRVD